MPKQLSSRSNSGKHFIYKWKFRLVSLCLSVLLTILLSIIQPFSVPPIAFISFLPIIFYLIGLIIDSVRNKKNARISIIATLLGTIIGITAGFFLSSIWLSPFSYHAGDYSLVVFILFIPPYFWLFAYCGTKLARLAWDIYKRQFVLSQYFIFLPIFLVVLGISIYTFNVKLQQNTQDNMTKQVMNKITISNYVEKGPFVVQQPYPTTDYYYQKNITSATELVISAKLYLPKSQFYNFGIAIDGQSSAYTLALDGKVVDYPSATYMSEGSHQFTITFIQTSCPTAEELSSVSKVRKPMQIEIDISAPDLYFKTSRFHSTQPHSENDFYLHCELNK